MADRIILYANDIEIKYMQNRIPKLCVGYQAVLLSECITAIKNAKRVVLFGTCGLVGHHPLNMFVAPIKWIGYSGRCITLNRGMPYIGYTSYHSVKTKSERKELEKKKVLVVDQESYIVGRACELVYVDFISIKYIIDKCDRRAVPYGINHYWREHQHKRMQKLFDECIERKYEPYK